MLVKAISEFEAKLEFDFDKKLEEKNKEIETIKTEFETRISGLEAKIKVLEGNKSPSISAEEISKSWVNAVKMTSTPQQMLMINTVANETKERERREKNVVIFGIKSSLNADSSKAKDEDGETIKKVFKDLNVEVEVKSIFKLKTKSSNPPPFVVILKDQKERNEILKKARELRYQKINSVI